jgi:hypothetical protein
LVGYLVKPAGLKVQCSKCKEIFKVYPPESQQQEDRRKHQRVQTRNLISHLTFDKTGKLVSRGLSKALDISKGGILLETPYPIESGVLSLMAADVDSNLVEIGGKLIYCFKTSNGMYLSGIAFVGTEPQMAKFVAKVIKEYNFRRNNLMIAVA